MSFYGNITNTSRTTFQFDKIYANRYTMDLNASVDNVYAGRYVLVEYDTALTATDYDEGLYLVSNLGQHILYGAIDSCKGENIHLYFNSPVESTHVVADDLGENVIEYIAPNKHFTIQNQDVMYVRVRSNGTYQTVSEEVFRQHYDLDDENIPHAHIGNEVAVIDNHDIFTDEVTEVYAIVFPGQKYKYNTEGELWIVDNETFTVNGVTFKVLNQLSTYTSNYLLNFDLDNRRYQASRGYDSTVWQKVYQNNVEKYVMIAELNTVVPTFGVTADAPSLLPISPHFGTDTTNVYYDLHWQPAWGFRVKAANNTLRTTLINPNGQLQLLQEGVIDSQLPGVKTRIKDKVFYPSDQFMQWSHTFEDKTLSGDESRKTLYYNPTSEKWSEDSDVLIPAAIYFNKDGFNSTEITYSEDLISSESRSSTWNKYNSTIADSNWKNDNAINFTPTGLSGNQYNPHNHSLDRQTQEDIQELSIMLPSIGDTIAKVWDIVYGGRNTNPGILKTSLRNKDIAWEDAKAKPSRRGLRLVGEGGDKYNTAEVDTLAGAINTAHDLIGMIICSNTDEELEDIERLDKNRIYYNSDRNAYFRKHETYELEPIDDTEFEHEEVSSSGLNQDEIDKGLYYTYNELTGEYELATTYNANTQYYIKQITNPYEEIDYELIEFPYEDANGKVYAWYQDYLSENTRFVEALEDDSDVRKLHSDYVYDETYHPDRDYFYVSAVEKSLSSSYRPRAYWYETIANREKMLVLDTNEEETRGRTYYTFNPSDMMLCDHTMIYVPGIYYFKLITGPNEGDFEYKLDWTSNKTQNGLISNVYKENGEVIYYQLNIFSTTSQTGEEIIYQAVYVYDVVSGLNEDNFLVDIYYYIDPLTGKYQLAHEYVANRTYYIRQTTYREVKDNMQVELEVINQWFSSNLALYYPDTFYTRDKDTNGNVISIREITNQRFINERDRIFDEQVYTFGRDTDETRDNYYKKMTDPDVKGTGDNVIIQRQDEFYQGGAYHYMKDGSYVLDTNKQFTEGRTYYVLQEITKLEADLHFYEKDKYYAESENEEGYQLVTDNELPEDTTFYKKNEYYVVDDELSILPIGAKWNSSEIAIPDTITLGKKVPVYELIELPNYSVNTNTLNGMLITLHQLLEQDDKENRSDDNLTGLMNQLKDLLANFSVTKAREFMIVDDYGRYHNAPFTGDNWLKVTVDGDPINPSIKINHTYNGQSGTNLTHNFNSNDVNSDNISIDVLTHDATGHMTKKDVKTITLPYNWKKFTSSGISSETTDLGFPKDSQDNPIYSSNIVATNCKDTLAIEPGNVWLKMYAGVVASTNTFTIAHTVNPIDITSNDTNLSSTGSFTVKDITNDAAGHITANKPHTYTLPNYWDTFKIGSGANAVTLSPSKFKDTLNLADGGQVKVEIINESVTQQNQNPITNTIKISHTGAGNATSTVNDTAQSVSLGGSFNVTTVGIDENGHVSTLSTSAVSISDISYTDSSSNIENANVMTGLSYSNGTITGSKSRVGDLLLTGFAASNSSADLAATDSINVAFGKLEKKIKSGIGFLNNTTPTIPVINPETGQQALDGEGNPEYTQHTLGSSNTITNLVYENSTIKYQVSPISISLSQIFNLSNLSCSAGEPIVTGTELEPTYTTYACGEGNTLAAISQTNGLLSYTITPIKITSGQVSDFSSSVYGLFTPSSNAPVNNNKCILTCLVSSGETSYIAKNLEWSDISPLLPSGDNAFATVSHTHTLSIAKNESGTASSITLEADSKYTLAAGGNTYIFKMDNFALSSHNHTLSMVEYIAPTPTEQNPNPVEETENITLAANTKYTLTAGGNTYLIKMGNFAVSSHDHNGVYALEGHTHSAGDITNLGNISQVLNIETSPAVEPDPDIPGDEGTPAVTTQSLIDYVRWLEQRIAVLENANT